MQNPNNVREIITHQLRPIAHDALSIETFRLLKEDGTLYPKASLPKISQAVALKIYNTMVFTRLLDERMQASQRQGRISFYMQCTGEEAAITASAAALEDKDLIMPQYREHAALHYRGFSLEEFMNQMFSNAYDWGKGRQMPVHYGKADLHYYTVSSPLSTQIPQASGYAYGQKLSGTKQCTLCYFGDGAASEGDFHAGLNMAAVHEVPAIFFCRNNGYAISTDTHEQFAGDGIASRGVGYGIEAIRVDGYDTLAVYAATCYARHMVVKHNKPILIEALVYRSAAHSTSDDPSGYRTKDEEHLFLSKDPIQRFRQWLLKQCWITEKEDHDYKQTVKEEILTALKKAEVQPKPSIDTIIEDVYDTPTPQLYAQLDTLKNHIARHADAYPSTSKQVK